MIRVLFSILFIGILGIETYTISVDHKNFEATQKDLIKLSKYNNKLFKLTKNKHNVYKLTSIDDNTHYILKRGN